MLNFFPNFQGKSVECLLCEAVIQQLDKEMEKNSTEKKVNATVYGICEKLPGAFQDLVSTNEPPADKKSP